MSIKSVFFSKIGVIHLIIPMYYFSLDMLKRKVDYHTIYMMILRLFGDLNRGECYTVNQDRWYRD